MQRSTSSMKLCFCAKLSVLCVLAASLVASQDPAIAAVARTGMSTADQTDATKDFGFEDYAIFTQGYESQLPTSSAGSLDNLRGDYEFEAPEESSSCGKSMSDGAFASLCELRLSGADLLAKTVPGGIDGVYAVKSCQGGRPTYLRKNSPVNQDRLLWYSTQNRAWDLTNGTDSNEEELLLYGGEAGDHLRPEYVKDTWFVKTGFDPADHSNGEFEPAVINVMCDSRWKRLTQKEPKVNVEKLPRPYMTQEEMDQEYRSAIEPRLQERFKAENKWTGSVGGSRLSAMVGVVVGALALLYFLPRCLERRLRQRRGGDGRAWLGLVPMGPKPASS